MTWREWLAPVVTVNLRQYARIQRQSRIIADQDRIIDGLTERLRRLYADVDLLACCVPVDHRQDALALVRDRHRIEDLDEIEEAGW